MGLLAEFVVDSLFQLMKNWAETVLATLHVNLLHRKPVWPMTRRCVLNLQNQSKMVTAEERSNILVLGCAVRTFRNFLLS